MHVQAPGTRRQAETSVSPVQFGSVQVHQRVCVQFIDCSYIIVKDNNATFDKRIS